MITRPQGFENKTPLKRPIAPDAAPQTREMGLKVGQTIISREAYGSSWNEAKLKLIWRGATVAVFECWKRKNHSPDWTHKGEKANWTLNCREWFLIEE